MILSFGAGVNSTALLLRFKEQTIKSDTVRVGYSVKKVNYRMLDCYCGLGGASEGFHREGFDCTGIDIVNVGYPYRFIEGDMNLLKGEDYPGYDVIWGSPPCRDFTILNDATWKEKKKPERGLILVKKFLAFVAAATPDFWIMENVKGLTQHLKLRPQQISLIGNPHKIRAFWGNYPPFLMPIQMGLKPCDQIGKPFGKLRSWERAKIPLAGSLAFARACKTELVT